MVDAPAILSIYPQADRAATYTETDHEASGRDALVETLVAEIQDDSEIRENSAAWGGVPRPRRLR